MPMKGKGTEMKCFTFLGGFSLLPALGILAYRMTAWTLYRSDFAYFATDVYTFSLLAQFVSLILLIVLERKITYTFSAAQKLIGIAACIMALGSGMVVVSLILHENSFALIPAGCVIHGAASALLFLGWGWFTCSIKPKLSALSVALAFVFYSCAAFLLQKASFEVLCTLTVISPLVCGALLLYCQTTLTPQQEEELSPTQATLKKLPWGIFGLLLACCIASALTEAIVPLKGSKEFFSFNYFWPPLFLLVFVVFFVWTKILKRNNPDQLWLFFAFIVFVGLLGFSSFSFIDLDTSAKLMRATQDCLFMFSWVFMAGLIYREKLPKVMFFGLGTLLFLYLRPFPALFFGWIFPEMRVESGSALAVGLAFALALVLIICILLLMNKHTPLVEKQKMPSLKEIPFADSYGVDCLIRDYNLSSREGEVVELLLRGYTLPQIGKELFISHDTVRSHAKNIYRKIDIHSKQELIKIVEQKNTPLR